jgi:hypothetical protein
MLSPENLSLLILLGIVIFFIGLMLLPVEIIVEEEAVDDEALPEVLPHFNKFSAGSGTEAQ